MQVCLKQHGARAIARVVGLALALSAVTAQAFDLQGHRGARGLAPENSLAGFERALAVGVHTLELDVVITSDGVPVISHDTSPNPDITRDATGRWLQSSGPPFFQRTLADLAEFDIGRINPVSRYAMDFPLQQPVDGQRIPTLAALFERMQALRADHVRFNIETKLHPLRPAESPEPEAFARAVIDVVRAWGMGSRVSIQSFDWRTLAAVQRIAPELPVVHLTAQLPRFNNLDGEAWTAGLRLRDHPDVPALVAAAGGRTWSPHHSNLSQQLISRARRLGLKVIPWTVNEATDMERLLNWGVDGIITDYPDRLRTLMAQRGMKLPPVIEALTPLQQANHVR
ncbi:MAG TPA: glycerophosphodiester phosphodiesterase [Hydrogenophaga sp.]|uniref:glycerophosphodiester phosphodiesterase n=1 Tax=Hydrogenophaga sp. TaxID=1904254 RepID=UPI002BFFB8E4|nr:glycerophosphodiester phosphodiesterase [Hydrogenophaga sp.]HMN93779.1 glycerophosphodiester phosphodiesterase [Hydrogenophaga sp.]